MTPPSAPLSARPISQAPVLVKEKEGFVQDCSIAVREMLPSSLATMTPLSWSCEGRTMSVLPTTLFSSLRALSEYSLNE